MELLDVRKQNPWWETKERINEDPKIRDYVLCLSKIFQIFEHAQKCYAFLTCQEPPVIDGWHA